MIIKKGTILVLEHGEYSDYCFDGPFRVLRKFDQRDVADAFKAQWVPKHEWRDDPDESDFIGWMTAQRYIEPIDAHRWHIGSYGFNPQIQSDPA